MSRTVIIGGGISGLTAAYSLLKKRPDLDVMVLESEDRPGGKIWSDHVNGFLCEKGPNGFLDNKPGTLELCESLGLDPVRSNENSKKRFIFSKGKLNALPESPGSFIRSDLLSWAGKLRLLGELIAPKGPDDETVAEFIKRRLGKEALEQLIDPMCSGVYAGDPDRMSIKSCFPRIKELEQEYGSLIKALIKIKKKRKSAASKGSEVSAAPGGTLTSFHNGIQTITDTLAARLGERVKLSTPASGITKSNGTYIVTTPDGSVEAEILIIASPAYAAAFLLADIDKELTRTLYKIPYPHVAVVCFGYRSEMVSHPLDGFGFLIPYNEGKRILGNLWDSSIFPNRAAEGHVLLRTMLGGAKHPLAEIFNDNEIADIVLAELRPILGIKADPEMLKVYRWEKAIPQYLPEHGGLLEHIEKRLAEHQGLYLTGNAYRGIGINDCVENGNRLAGTIIGKLEGA